MFGIDLSPGMIEVARRTYPGLRFEVGSMLALDLPDASLGGVLAARLELGLESFDVAGMLP